MRYGSKPSTRSQTSSSRVQAIGVGVALALACDLTVAAEHSYFLLAFSKVGLMPDGGATALVAASIGRARAMKMALLAERLPASEALAAGLIADVYSDGEFHYAIESLTCRLTNGPTDAYRWTKDAVNDATLTELDIAFARERKGQLELLATPDFEEGVTAFLDKRPAAIYTGPAPRTPESVEGWDQIAHTN